MSFAGGWPPSQPSWAVHQPCRLPPVDVEAAKRAAGEEAATLVEDGMTLGLGTGSTARWFILAVGRRLRDGLRVRGVATSLAATALATEVGIPMVDPDD